MTKDVDTTVFNPAWGIDTTKYIVPVKYPSTKVIKLALNLYQTELKKPSHVVFCLDYSGSMSGIGYRQLMNAMDYMNYLVSSMVDSGNKQMNNLGNSMYYLTIHDDTSNTFGGTYFKVTEVSDKTRNIATTNAYEIDVNYPEDHMVTEFNVNNNQVWSILYETATTLKQEDYSYQIDREGNLQIDKAPGIIKSPITNKVSPTLNNWWTKMTSFPISASITIKGLTRPSILMSYVKVNVWFNGAQKHISSGLYIVTQQTDYINANGYRTRLELLRIGGD